MRTKRLWKLETGARISRVLRAGSDGWITMARMKDQGVCPVCGRRSRKRHGWRHRTLQDLPIQGEKVTMRLQLSRWLCQSKGCSRRTFSDQLPALAAPFATEPRQAHMKAFRLALRLEHRSAALAHAEQVLRHDPRNPDALVLKARMLALDGDAGKAAEAIDAALDLGGERADIVAEAGAITMQYDLENAGALLTRALSAHPDNPIVVVESALAECMPTRCVLAVVLATLADECRRSGRCDANVAKAVRDAVLMQEADGSAARDQLQLVLDRLL